MATPEGRGFPAPTGRTSDVPPESRGLSAPPEDRPPAMPCEAMSRKHRQKLGPRSLPFNARVARPVGT
eukprot:3706319-Alexandrium_andersonii.AAC.1